jgi:hypothetical protein
LATAIELATGFVAVNPNAKIPAPLDRNAPTAIRVFESDAILLYVWRREDEPRPTLMVHNDAEMRGGNEPLPRPENVGADYFRGFTQDSGHRPQRGDGRAR